MDHEEYLMIIDMMEEINTTLNKLKKSPLLVTETDLDILEFNLSIISDYAKQLKRRKYD